jgi:hypothetical protein
MKEALCQAFCAGITVTEVPVGLSIGLPFRRGDDALGIYVVYSRHDSMYARLEDDGLTVSMLEDAGIDLSEGPRRVMFAGLLDEFGVAFDDVERVLHTPYLSVNAIPQHVIRFSEFLVRMQDFVFLTVDRVEDTFRHDVEKQVIQRFRSRAEIQLKEPPTIDLRNYVADMVIRPPNRMPLALFIGNSETKALEAIVLQQQTEIEQRTVIDQRLCHVMLVVQGSKRPRIKDRTMQRIRAKSDLSIASFDEDPEGTLRKMEAIMWGLQSSSLSQSLNAP